MKQICILLFLLLGALPGYADSLDELWDELPPIVHRVYKGHYYFKTEESDSSLMLVMKQITVFPAEKFKNNRQEQFYWRTVRDVKKALPYAKLIAATLIETYEYIETLPTKEAREKHLKAMEKDVFNEYKPELKRFSRRQAKVLVKLIYRETNQPTYDIIKAFLGNFRAGFWQAFGKIFGVSLKANWDPKKDDKDAMIERICVRIEQGSL